jgi:selenocysteine lyase/cysteine desulfurase
MNEKKLQVALPYLQGRPVLRLSSHIYVTEAEISQGVEILRDFNKLY